MRFKPAIFIFAMSAFLLLSLKAQQMKYELLCKIPLQGGSFTTDNLQNIYTYHGSTMQEYNAMGKLLYTHSDKSFGAVTSVDVSNPLKIMVFYKDFPQIAFLDNTLSINGNTISPSDLGYPLAALACASHDNGVWLFDAQNQQLVRYDASLNLVQKSGNIAQLLGVTMNPLSMQEYNSYLYVNDTAKGLLVFDVFGTYFKTIPIKGLTDFQIRGDDMFYLQAHKIHIFHLKTIMEDVTNGPDTVATQARIEKNRLYESYSDTIRVYDIKQ